MSHKSESLKRNGRVGMLEAFRNRLTESSRCGSLVSAKTQDKQSIAQNPVYLAIASPKHCELWNLQVGCPSEKPDLSDHFLKRSPERDKQRKWWCKVPVWRERYHGLIRSDTGKRFKKSYAIVPPNALFVLYLEEMKWQFQQH